MFGVVVVYTFFIFHKFGRLYLFHLLPILSSNTFCHAQFFTTLSTSAPPLYVMLIHFNLLAFSSSRCFLCILQLEYAITCCLHQIVPFEEKLDFSTCWVTFYKNFFPFFSHWMLSHFPLLFTYLHCFCDSIASFGPSYGPPTEQVEWIFCLYLFLLSSIMKGNGHFNIH